jgi:hypothetical protein
MDETNVKPAGYKTIPRRGILLAALVLAGCQATGINPNVSSEDEATFVQITDEAALMGIISGRTVEYTEDSSKDAGKRQSFLRNGNTSYAGTPGTWKMEDGQYCSNFSAWDEPNEFNCYPVYVNRSGTQIRWVGEDNVWFAKFL